MQIQGTAISVTYKKINNLKREFYKNEDNFFKDYFNEPAVLPVPDDAPDEIPRIIIKTLNEHAQLSITPTVTTLHIAYNDGFEKDWDKCAAYIKERMDAVFKFLNVMTDDKYDYIGIVTNVLKDDMESGNAALLADNLLKSGDISKKLYDINIQYTFVEDDSIFVNIRLQNARLFNEGVAANTAGALSSENQYKETIGAIIDINDRYGFNSKENYYTNSGNLSRLMDKMSNVINNKLQPLILKGTY